MSFFEKLTKSPNNFFLIYSSLFKSLNSFDKKSISFAKSSLSLSLIELIISMTLFILKKGSFVSFCLIICFMLFIKSFFDELKISSSVPPFLFFSLYSAIKIKESLNLKPSLSLTAFSKLNSLFSINFFGSNVKVSSKFFFFSSSNDISIDSIISFFVFFKKNL